MVTGAAGELGRGIADRLHADGYTVVGLDRAPAPADLGPFRAWTVADQTERTAVDEALLALTSQHGPLDVVVANAGYAKFGSWLDLDARTFERHVSVNLVGTFHVLQAAARRMAEAGRGGSLVVISSSLALTHADQVGPYCVTKSALLDLTRSMAAELGVHGIRVNAVLPGVVETGMTHGMLAAPGVRDDLVDRTPLRRLGAPQDIAAAVAFLASADAAWVSGATLGVDGGQSLYGQPQWMRQRRHTFNEPTWEPGLGEHTPTDHKESTS
ncbi:MAG: SDR family oxidoreductase [Actinobacteria bacterium]|nr:SDR family oxidoreductase [Actinomycetota bacterium]